MTVVRTSPFPPRSPHATGSFAPMPVCNFGTPFQLRCSYDSRNNRNKISYDSTNFSYDLVPISATSFRAAACPKTLRGACRCPSQIQIAPPPSLLACQNRNIFPATIQLRPSEQLDPTGRPATVPARYKSPHRRPFSLAKIGAFSSYDSATPIGTTRPLRKANHSPSQIQLTPVFRPLSALNRNKKSYLAQSYHRNNRNSSRRGGPPWHLA